MSIPKQANCVNSPTVVPSGVLTGTHSPRWRRLTVWLLTASVLLAAGWLLLATRGLAAPDDLGAAASSASARPVIGTSALPLAVTWSNFAPTGWVTSLPATVTLTAQAPGGLMGGTAACAVSTDGGASWTAWSASGLAIGGVLSTTQFITVTGLVLVDSANANRVRFQIQEVGGTIVETSPAYSVLVDTKAPTATVLSPNGGEVWAGGGSYAITWTAGDVVGLGAAPITINVSYNGGAAWTPLVAAVANTGSFAWIPPAINTNQALIEVLVVDLAGNRVTDRSDAPFTISSNAPGTPQNLHATPVGWTNASSFGVSWTNPPDLVNVTGAWYKLDAAPTGPSDGSFVSTTNTIAGIVPSGDGIHPIYVWLQDQFGRADHTKAAMTQLYWDRTPPAPPFGLQGVPARTWTNVNAFTERWMQPSDVSGIAGVYYRINRAGMYPTDGIFVSTTMTIVTGIQVPTDGKHDLYIWLVDAAGNVDQNNRNIDPQVFWYDATPPISWAGLTPSPSSSGWYSSSVTAVFTATDSPDGSGIDEIRNRLDGAGWSGLPWVTINGEGLHRIDYFAVDIAGNLEPTHTITVPLDFTAPVVTLTPDRQPPASGWYTAPVTFTLNISDALSGNGGGYCQLNAGAWQIGTQIKLTADGRYDIECYGQDNAGNRGPLRSAQAKLDTTPPSTAYLIDGTQGDGGWFTSPLSVRLIPSDNESGVAATQYSINGGPWQAGTQFQLVANGYYSVSFYSVDVAGNVESSFPVQLKLDTLAPAAPAAVDTSPSAWSQINRFSVQWANPTDLSGIAGVYYRMDQEPASPTDGVFSSQTNRLDNLAVPGEGAHRLYLWLRDGAGNTDHRNRTLAPLLRFDATPPTTTLRIQGLAGDNGWYRSPITVNLEALDLASGVASTSYRVNGGAWVTGTSLLLDTSDKHVLDYSSEDVAGNVEMVREATLRIDQQAPAAPADLVAQPSGWRRDNSFTLIWRDPVDQSGIAGAYVRFDGPPTGPTDGAFFPASQVLEGVQVPGEGRHDVYVWLRDRAGNADQSTAVALLSALWYDGTPPSTVISVTGGQGEQGWYLEPVTFTMSAADSASGVKETRWQLDDGAWITGTGFTVDIDGQHVVRITSEDIAGNVEALHVFQINIDRQAPVVRMGALDRHQTGTRFDVSWSGEDPIGGAGVATFDVQVRDGYAADWTNWLVGTTQTTAQYQGQRGHTYFFRARARDRAGNQSAYTDDSTYAVVEVVINGDFSTGNFSNWSASGILYSAVLPVADPGGTTGLVARLGSPNYGESTTPPGNVPVGDATIMQMITVPPLGDVVQPTLAFWYRVLTYDVLYSERLQRYIDDLEVTIRSADGQPVAVLLRAGNPTQTYGRLYDTGWRYATFDLSPYAGQTVQLAFSNYNREDNLFNTWSFVDGIQVQGWPFNRHVYMPLVVGGGGATTPSTAPAGAAEEPVLPSGDGGKKSR